MTMLLAVNIANIVRVVVLVLAALAAGAFPPAVMAQGRRSSAWLAVAGSEILFLSTAAAIIAHWDRPIVWYRTPLIGVAAVLYLAFSERALRGH